jgi:hypothetical protein
MSSGYQVTASKVEKLRIPLFARADVATVGNCSVGESLWVWMDKGEKVQDYPWRPKQSPRARGQVLLGRKKQ